MNQHPKAKAAGITPGEWRIEMDDNYMRLYTGSPVLTGDVARGYVGEGSAKVMADALNTMNAHGHTPSEMVEIIRELRRVLKCYNNLSGGDILDGTKEYLDFEDDVVEALNKTEGF